MCIRDRLNSDVIGAQQAFTSVLSSVVSNAVSLVPVSYTHLDVYKRQPLAGWSASDMDRYAAEHAVLLNPLLQLGYASIGCEPCTRPVAEGEDPRACLLYTSRGV